MENRELFRIFEAITAAEHNLLDGAVIHVEVYEYMPNQISFMSNDWNFNYGLNADGTVTGTTVLCSIDEEDELTEDMIHECKNSSVQQVCNELTELIQRDAYMQL